MRILMRILNSMTNTIAPIEVNLAENTKKIARTQASRPDWNKPYKGLTWRDMPSQSSSGTTCRKLLFALYRKGATTREENFFIEEKRRRIGLN
jgi:hypothetical protein